MSGGNPAPIGTPLQNPYLLSLSADKSRIRVQDGPPIEEHPLWELPVLRGSARTLGERCGPVRELVA